MRYGSSLLFSALFALSTTAVLAAGPNDCAPCKDLQRKIDTLNTQINTLNGQVSKLTAQVNTLNPQVASLNGAVKTLTDRVTKLEQLKGQPGNLRVTWRKAEMVSLGGGGTVTQLSCREKERLSGFGYSMSRSALGEIDVQFEPDPSNEGAAKVTAERLRGDTRDDVATYFFACGSIE
jgi:outer membrane murein-binding lipoprotein Lpp